MIEVNNLGKNYGSFAAVRDVDFSVGAGEIVGLLGPNGAGKTTIMKILTGYMFPSFGAAKINNFDVEKEPTRVKEIVGYLPENTPLYMDLNVYEFLNFIADARQLKKQERKKRIEYVINECALEQVIYRNISEISKGYRQRTGVAQAIIHDPQVLILDEPTTGLDPYQIIEIRDLIKRMGKEKTVLVSTHIMQEVELICDRVLILNQGKIVAKGTTAGIGQELRGEHLITLTLKCKEFSPLKQAFATCPVVEKVIKIEELGSDKANIKLALKPDTEEALFDWVVENGHKILAMIPHSYSLEEIFIKLTREEKKSDY